MTEVQELGLWTAQRSFDDLSESALRELKIRVLDSLACAAGALDAEPVVSLHRHTARMGGNALAPLLGHDESTAPDRAALYNGFLVRYLDYNDSFLAPKETCHPSDNVAPVLAAASYAETTGRQLLTALAIAYQVQCRLSEEAPVRAQGFDHTSQGSFAAAAGVAHALGLDAERTAHAIAISGTAYQAMRVTRTGSLSHWKGLAYPSVAWTATHSAFLALDGITGPPEVFEGNKGYKESVARHDFYIDWSLEDLEKVTGSIIKKYNAEIHSQSTLEGLLELKHREQIDPRQVARIELDTFDVAYHIIGGGEEGGKKNIRTKEEADHSLPYMMAAALLDDEVKPAQYEPERIAAEDVQQLLQRVEVRESPALSRDFPQAMPVQITVEMNDGSRHQIEKRDYEGFHTRPAGWDMIEAKFRILAGDRIDANQRKEITEGVKNLEHISVQELQRLLRAFCH